MYPAKDALTARNVARNARQEHDREETVEKEVDDMLGVLSLFGVLLEVLVLLALVDSSTATSQQASRSKGRMAQLWTTATRTRIVMGTCKYR